MKREEVKAKTIVNWYYMKEDESKEYGISSPKNHVGYDWEMNVMCVIMLVHAK